MAEPLPVPAYGRASLADLMPSVLASLGVAGEADVLGLPGTARAVVLLVDGMGERLLRRHADEAPFLSSLASRDLTAGFPATNVTSLSSFGTGLPPGEHGLTGYTSWVEEVDDAVGWLTWSSVRGGADLRERLVPEQVQPRQTVFDRAVAAGVEVTVAAPAHFGGSGLTRAVLRGGDYRGTITPGDVVGAAVAGSRAGSRSLVYCYTADLDTTGHVRGVDSEAWRSQLRLVDRFAEELAGRLPRGTVLHVTADHGMVDVRDEAKVDLDASEVLQEGVRAVAGEPRVRHVHVHRGETEAVLARWRGELGDRMWVGTREEVVQAGLLGPIAGAAARARTGDVVAIATGEVALVRWENEAQFSGLIGQHGALTDDELRVPLLSA